MPVHPVDTRQIGAGTGYAAVRAAEARRRRGRRRARRRRSRGGTAEQTLTLFYVDTLEYLRRGGRVGAAAALVGSALAVKPILEVEDGRVVTREKVRTSGRAWPSWRSSPCESAADRPVDLTVSHLEQPAGRRGAGRLPGSDWRPTWTAAR